MSKTKVLRYTAIALAIVIGIIWTNTTKEAEPPTSPRDYPEIAKEGVLRAATEYNTLSYHVQKDTIVGFDYELLNLFAKAKGLRLEITPEMSFEKRIEGILKGKFDLLAVGTVVTSRLKDSLLFTHTLLRSKQILVQRKKTSENDSSFIDNQLQLSHKTLYVVKDSPALLRIHNLINEIADTIYIKEIAQYGPEQLLAMVAEGDIDYAVCDENIAQTSLKQFPNLDINTDIGFTQFYAWGVNKRSTALLDSLNTWLDAYLQTEDYKKLYQKYY